MVKDRAKKCHKFHENSLRLIENHVKRRQGVEGSSHFPIHRKIITHENLKKVM